MYLQCTFNVNLSFRLLTLRINLKTQIQQQFRNSLTVIANSYLKQLSKNINQ